MSVEQTHRTNMAGRATPPRRSERPKHGVDHYSPPRHRIKRRELTEAEKRFAAQRKRERARAAERKAETERNRKAEADAANAIPLTKYEKAKQRRAEKERAEAAARKAVKDARLAKAAEAKENAKHTAAKKATTKVSTKVTKATPAAGTNQLTKAQKRRAGLWSNVFDAFADIIPHENTKDFRGFTAVADHLDDACVKLDRIVDGKAAVSHVGEEESDENEKDNAPLSPRSKRKQVVKSRVIHDSDDE